MELADKLLTVRHLDAMAAHITVDSAKCEACQLRPCRFFCPAACFTEEDGAIKFGYEGCLECGTCRIMCPAGALTWEYPRGGYGVSFRIG